MNREMRQSLILIQLPQKKFREARNTSGKLDVVAIIDLQSAVTVADFVPARLAPEYVFRVLGFDLRDDTHTAS
jgi:hypothetical protein